MAEISVLVCDDHALLRSGLRRLLDAEDDLGVVGEAANAEEAVERARALEPGVVLLDIVMPGRSGLDALPEILAAAPAAKVLMLSMQDEPGYVRRAFASGASGYLPGGEVFACLGPNGAGKTTTIRLLLDLIRPSSDAEGEIGNAALAPVELADVLQPDDLGHPVSVVAGAGSGIRSWEQPRSA